MYTRVKKIWERCCIGLETESLNVKNQRPPGTSAMTRLLGMSAASSDRDKTLSRSLMERLCFYLT